MNTLETIKQVVQADIDREEIGIQMYERILGVIKKFEGKKITKAMATAVEKELSPEGYVVSYSPRHGMFYVSIWKKNYNDRIEFLFGHESDPTFRIGDSRKERSGFAYSNTCYGDAAKERNAARLAMLQNEEGLNDFARVLDTMKEAKAAFAKAEQVLSKFSRLDNPSIYSIKKAVGLD